MRDLAENDLSGRPANGMDATLNEKKLLHELQVHQIELEMQNEALQQARNAEKTSLARYTELFELRLSLISNWRLTAGSSIRIFAALGCCAAIAAT